MERNVWAWMPVAASPCLWIGVVACAVPWPVLPRTAASVVKHAQFERFHPFGYPARALAQLRSPGEVVPVDTSRTQFLPQVGNGPLPATRRQMPPEDTEIGS
jgi:hypothetical protein